ncbi:TMV resistance protein N-like [Dorcoceras hygrometricum]|uniref:TMV resistance protein N-like n=1 Tax=Dorcoceras hygrometricum TaxID=472368 RepID=A0A2Z7A886_9LAMI|nr:TMV resistance protein N-like [Dorcoceras hygrometricum]
MGLNELEPDVPQLLELVAPPPELVALIPEPIALFPEPVAPPPDLDALEPIVHLPEQWFQSLKLCASAQTTSIRSMTGYETPSSACTRRSDEIGADGFSSSSWPEQIMAAQGGGGGTRAAVAAAYERREGAAALMIRVRVSVVVMCHNED